MSAFLGKRAKMTHSYRKNIKDELKKKNIYLEELNQSYQFACFVKSLKIKKLIIDLKDVSRSVFEMCY